jgi:hypothetical protein
MRLSFLAALFLLAPVAAHAQGLDRDSLLTDAPATPVKGTVRVTGSGAGTTTDASGANNGSGSVTGTISYTPFEHFSADVGAYFQAGAQGPSARVRYQFLTQEKFGVDLSGGVRFKTVGFHPDNGEVEMIVAAGRKLGRFELVLNGVFGVGTGGGGGKDLEVKGFAGYRFSEAVRAGIDSRMQTEVSDEANAGPKFGRDYDLTSGPAVSWMVTRAIQLQGLVGVAQPKKTNVTAPVGVLSASVDF